MPSLAGGIGRCVVMAKSGPSEDELIQRIIMWRAAGWSFRRIGAQLEAEGFDKQHPEHLEQQLLRHLVHQRDSD